MKEIDFQGNLYVIDTNTEVLEYVREKYKMLIPKAKIICINKEFKEAYNDVPIEFDLLLSNHCIDDMIISEFMKNYYNKNQNSNNFKDLLTEAWIELGKDTFKIDDITNKVFVTFKDFFLNKKIGMVIMSQYKSNLYFKDEFKEMDEITAKCFEKIKHLIRINNECANRIIDFYPFGEDERYKGEYLLNNTQNPKNWIIGSNI